MPAIERFRVLLFSSDGIFVNGHYERSGEALPQPGNTIDVRATSDRATVIRARVTNVTPGYALPIAAGKLDA